MSAAVAVMTAALAAALAVSVPRGGRRLARLLSEGATPAIETTPAVNAVWLVGVAAALVVGATVGPWLGVGAGVMAVAVGRRRPRPPPPLDVPLVADLLAACLAAGATVVDALHAAGAASPEAATVCRPVADRLAAGATPREAWADWLQRPDLAAMGRACARGADSGAATTPELRRAADRARAQRRAELTQRAQRAAVWAVLPLGICFLPAFVLVGIVPFALGLFGR
jgi:Type II secretion system (T2SS), protein F